jgi:uncharacterized protein (TIGR00297 family)
MVCAIATYFYPQYANILRIGYTASLATKLSDTFASEIGKAYGKSTYLITTLKPVPRGTEGAISLEGTFAGIVGSIMILLCAVAGGLVTSPIGYFAVIVAAFIATTIESFIGALYQDDIPWLSNELVNLLNTIIGGIVAMIISMIRI